ncbi:MAG: heme-copper oxidase subunit III [Gemmatimonadota bacterium]
MRGGAREGAVEETGSTGIPSRKLAMWTFIGSECMLFGSLIATFLLYEGRSVVGPYPDELLNVPFITVTTFVLLMSSLMMVLALAAVQRGDAKMARVWLFLTPLFGLIFLTGQYIEFSHFVQEGLGLSRNLFSSTFFVLTGTHGAHVAGGVLWLGTLWVLALRGRLTEKNRVTVEIAGLYWHFVDIVWIVLFTIIYLLE